MDEPKSLLDVLRERRAVLAGRPAAPEPTPVAPRPVAPSLVASFAPALWPERREFASPGAKLYAIRNEENEQDAIAVRKARLDDIAEKWLTGHSSSWIVRELAIQHRVSEGTVQKDLKTVHIMLAALDPATKEALYERAVSMATEAYRVANTAGPDGKKNPSVMVAATRVVAQLDGLLKERLDVNLGPQVDLSKLTDAELQQYRELQAKVAK